jgi:hypothetical protein
MHARQTRRGQSPLQLTSLIDENAMALRGPRNYVISLIIKFTITQSKARSKKVLHFSAQVIK